LKVRAIAAAAAALVVGLVLLVVTLGSLGHNNDQNWQVLQSVTGDVRVIDQPGYYWKGFGTVWTYPRTLEAFYSNHPNESKNDDSIKVTFNDGGTANVGAYVRVQLPNTTDQRRLLHRDFAANPENIKSAIRAHLVNVVKASGPVMSASENQSSRKAEFNQIVEEQLASGLFQMRRTEIELSDLTEIEEVGTGPDGAKTTREKKAKVQATEVVKGKDGKPVIVQPSPLSHYGLNILQFSITETEYDEATLRQFAAKKESYLNAEKSKAQRQEEVQQRLMVEEKGRRQAAEIEAEENKNKTRALIQANQAAEVAVIEKDQAVTNAKRLAEVAVVAKAQAVTEAMRLVEVAEQKRKEAEALRQIAEIKAKTAELEKQSTISVAEGKQKEIELGGGITEKERVLAQIAAERDAKVAEALSKMPVPSTYMNGGGEKGGSLTDNLINLALLKSTGILKDSK
jgi:hypothetical protein